MCGGDGDARGGGDGPSPRYPGRHLSTRLLLILLLLLGCVARPGQPMRFSKRAAPPPIIDAINGDVPKEKEAVNAPAEEVSVIEPVIEQQQQQSPSSTEEPLTPVPPSSAETMWVQLLTIYAEVERVLLEVFSNIAAQPALVNARKMLKDNIPPQVIDQVHDALSFCQMACISALTYLFERLAFPPSLMTELKAKIELQPYLDWLQGLALHAIDNAKFVYIQAQVWTRLVIAVAANALDGLGVSSQDWADWAQQLGVDLKTRLDGAIQSTIPIWKLYFVPALGLFASILADCRGRLIGLWPLVQPMLAEARIYISPAVETARAAIDTNPVAALTTLLLVIIASAFLLFRRASRRRTNNSRSHSFPTPSHSISSTLASMGLGFLEAKVLILGLDNAGKTTLLMMLKDNTLVVPNRTKAPNRAYLVLGRTRLQTIDLGGHETARAVHPWEKYIDKDVSGVVFVVDAAAPGRLAEAKRDLAAILSVDSLGSRVPVAVLGNKIDLGVAMSEAELRAGLGIEETVNKGRGGGGVGTPSQAAAGTTPDHLQGGSGGSGGSGGRPVKVFMCSFIHKMGYGQGFKWLIDNFSSHQE